MALDLSKLYSAGESAGDADPPAPKKPAKAKASRKPRSIYEAAVSGTGEVSEEELRELGVEAQALKEYISQRTPAELVAANLVKRPVAVFYGDDAAPGVGDDFGSYEELGELEDESNELPRREVF